jgi:hypothetical protein
MVFNRLPTRFLFVREIREEKLEGYLDPIWLMYWTEEVGCARTESSIKAPKVPYSRNEVIVVSKRGELGSIHMRY